MAAAVSSRMLICEGHPALLAALLYLCYMSTAVTTGTTPSSPREDELHVDKLPDDVRDQFQHEIRRHILSKLGMTRAPSSEEIARSNISDDYKQEMLRLYNETVGDVDAVSSGALDDQRDPVSDNDSSPFRHYRGYARQQNVSFMRWYASPLTSQNVSGNMLLFFPLRSPRGVPGLVDRATLRLFIILPETRSGTPYTNETVEISIYQILAAPGSLDLDEDEQNYPRRLMSNKRVMLSASGWVSFPVREAVEMWINYPSTNHGLTVECSSCFGTHFSANEYVVDDHGNWTDIIGENQHPRLDVVMRERRSGTPRKRQRRQHGMHTGSDASCSAGRAGGASGCCRRSLNVSFRMLDYNWILAPLEYNAYYCAGHCAQLDHVANTHAMIRALLRMSNPASSPHAQLCCTPSALGMLNILYFDMSEDGQVKLKLTAMPDMVVDHCSCA